jgi:hypothetical protein
VIKSADVNANFAAVAAAVSSDQSTIASLQSAVATLQTQVASLQTTLAGVQSTVAATPQIVGFAHFDGTKVASFGGSETTSAVAGSGSPTTITFTGKYPSSITAAKVHILATPEVGDFTALDTYVVGTPTSTTIEIGVYTWQSDNATYYGYQPGGPFYVALLLGS